jgi:hypothetical protein
MMVVTLYNVHNISYERQRKVWLQWVKWYGHLRMVQDM